MRKIKDKFFLILIIVVIGGVTTIKFNLFNINVKIAKIFSFEIKNVINRGYLDEVWDFEKVAKPDKSGYYNWVIGTKVEDISAARIASGTVVTFVGNKELNMNYKSMEDYYNRDGPSIFREFIEEFDGSND